MTERQSNEVQAAARSNWIPVRALAPRHRPRIATHLSMLDERDRYLRFGYVATDEQIRRYVDGLDFDHDELFGIFNRRLELIAMAHLAFPPIGADGKRPTVAEFGVTVLAKARGRGFGRRLIERATLLARNRHVDTLVIQALSENTTMLHIAAALGASLVRSGSESEARLALQPDTFGTHLDEMFENQAAEIDYGLKRSSVNVDRVLAAITDSSP